MLCNCSTSLVILLLLGLDHSRGAQEVVDFLELQRVLVVPLALIVVGGLEFLDVGHVDDVSLDGREDDHGGCLELALEPDGNTSLRGEDRATATGEEVVDEDLNIKFVNKLDLEKSAVATYWGWRH